MSTRYESKQEIFTRVFLGLAEQGFELSSNEYGNLYRGPNGYKCSAGHLIPDDMYDPEFEDVTFDRLPKRVVNLVGDNLDFVMQLQDIHDSGEKSPLLIHDHMVELAELMGLEVPRNYRIPEH